MSVAQMPIVAAKIAVSAPTEATTAAASGAALYSVDMRQTMYTPAVTIVAAWISADTGVGPAMASGSQTYSGICADLPVAPRKSSRQIAVMMPVSTPPAMAACC